MASGTFPITVPSLGFAGKNEYVEFNHRVVLGASGAIASQDPAIDTLVVAVKTAAKVGRYTLTLCGGRRFKQFRGGGVAIVGLADAIYGANTTGFAVHWRNDLLSSAGTVQVQFSRNTDNADAEVPDNFVLNITLLVKVK